MKDQLELEKIVHLLKWTAAFFSAMLDLSILVNIFNIKSTSAPNLV